MTNFLNKILHKKAPEPTGLVATTENKAEAARTGGSKPFMEGLVGVKDIIAPGAIEVDWDSLRIDDRYYRTMFVAGYPRFVGINWLSALVNFDASLSISMYIYPTDGKDVLDDLRRKIAEMEAELTTDIQRGRVVNPATQAKLEDALTLQADLVKGEERFFQFGLYITVSSKTKEDLDRITKNLESSLGSLMISTKKATLEMEAGFLTTLPTCNDLLSITRNMDTTSLASTFPFVSSDLSDDKGVMYGINEHNGSLVIFDRFSMPNYNAVVFASAGSGKSYLIKLEALRSLMFGAEVIVIDPENEYRELCEAVGGQYISFGFGEASKINPFDLSLVQEEGENALSDKILGLHKMFKVMIGEMDPMEESMLDRAIMDAYKMKGVTPDPETQTKEPPLLEDLYKSLLGMEEEKAKLLTAKLEKYIKGSFAGIFNQKSNVDLKSNFVVFGIRNLEESLRPVAMHVVLDYIWTVIKKTPKKRLLVVDEAWYLMQYPDSASFLRGIVKRGRKYYLGVTTITQDVDDFLDTPFGKEIVTNSAIQILLKQHTAAIDRVGETFYLSEGEKQLLLSADKGEGIFFAGQNHVAIRVIASPEEHALITSNPEELEKIRASKVKMAEQVQETKAQEKNITTKQANEQLAQEFEEKKEEEKILPTPIVEKPEIEIMPKLEVPSETPGVDTRKTMMSVTVEEDDHKNISEKIAILKTQEEEALLAHQKKTEQEALSKKMAEESEISFASGKLPKYADLFKAKPNLDKLPPLPSLPPLPTKNSSGTLAPKQTVVSEEKPKLELIKSGVLMKNTSEKKPTEAPKELPGKPSYEDLFGKGII